MDRKIIGMPQINRADNYYWSLAKRNRLYSHITAYVTRKQ